MQYYFPQLAGENGGKSTENDATNAYYSDKGIV